MHVTRHAGDASGQAVAHSSERAAAFSSGLAASMDAAPTPAMHAAAAVQAQSTGQACSSLPYHAIILPASCQNQQHKRERICMLCMQALLYD